jgi:hypothetical protein
VLAASVFIAFTALFYVHTFQDYELRYTPYSSPFAAVVQATTAPDERIWVAPHDPFVYFASRRAPASAVQYYLPWVAADPPLERQLVDELTANRPPIVVYNTDDLTFGQYPMEQWGQRVFQTLLGLGYAPLDPADPLLRHVLVRPDRLSDARGRLGLAGRAT